MKFLREKLNLRIYQQTILDKSINQNTLCVIPTGLGKTYIAVALSSIILKHGKVLMVAPTKPLVNQHKITFDEFFEHKKEIISITGTTPAKDREKIYSNAKIIIATPQTIKHDILAGRIDLKDFKLLIFDEAHRATGDYAYVSIAKYFAKIKTNRILALTASPGTDQDKIKEICANLHISNIELRNKTHPEVEPFVKPILTKYEFIELPQEFKKIKHHLELAIKDRLIILKQLGFIKTTEIKSLSKKALLRIQGSLRSRINEGDFNVMKGLSVTAGIIKLRHAVDLLESESISAVNSYFSNIWASSKTTNVKAVKNIVSDFHVRVAYRMIQEASEAGIEHPKLQYLRRVFEKVVSQKRDAKILIFTEFRSNIDEILKTLDGFLVEKFVGQASTVGKGMTQKQQIERIQMLKNSEINGLVCTSVAEEGLDIPSVDLVIFYSPVPSAIRSIQRRGRTGRQSIGNLIILIAKGTKDEIYFWVSKRQEQGMDYAINSVSKDLVKKPEQMKITDIKEKDKEEIIIFVDNRERGFIVEELHDLGAKLIYKNLEVGDFILSDDVCVERKIVSDFVNSLLDRRLFTQAIEIKRNFDKPLFILEGSIDELFKVRNIDPNAIRSAIISISLDYGIPIIFSDSPKETAKYLFQIARREQISLKKSVSLRGSRRDWPIEKQQQFLIEGLPMIGENMAFALLKKFKNPKNIANASIDELKEVEKLGPKKAEKIKAIFEEEFK
ncbi:DEAD/DEAH box helicase family protein [Candidatus Woesearchaeota archaeon]|nr:DEAD/DEAH box helicase family protein [Candidatus Woesearchaeota archaeon]